MSIETIKQTIEITGVLAITITDVVEDVNEGVYVREIRVHGVGGAQAPAFFSLRLVGAQAADVAIIAPEQTF